MSRRPHVTIDDVYRACRQNPRPSDAEMRRDAYDIIERVAAGENLVWGCITCKTQITDEAMKCGNCGDSYAHVFKAFCEQEAAKIKTPMSVWKKKLQSAGFKPTDAD